LEDLYAGGYRFSANICIYGESNLSNKENLSNKIEKLVMSYSWAKLYSHLDSNEFNEVLHSSSLYLRMNSEDSFGLVVAEAIEAGLDVIATNVCTRHQGAYLLSKDDFGALKKSLTHYLNGNNLEEIMDVQKPNIEIVELKSFCSLDN
jgi:glycosyltransferase involved in cell wall biosynthesis